uniref:ATP synthase F0 subunit 8 n=1 Tax=Macropsis perpetua TaxID=3035248 RepID=UPI002410D11F|nr:ATP synthase F0 subunit 8 [Macropsis perpetua]YP_010736861.1 ATP synthase F0 subunit 8 [Macropsis ocellata]WEP24722.1 ATP synthase F0 subunit 8 [Macropsis perpetua]WEP24735.1 ATP synthase F0 subunit 8 [Macropsis ocellata]
MPQMAPMWWFSLEILFVISMLIMMTNIYFNFKIKIKPKKSTTKNKIKWMW